MANIKIAQLTNATTIADTDIVLIEDATQTKKMTVANLKSLLGINSGGIVDSGSNANGSYIKFADGTMICTGNFDLQLGNSRGSANKTLPAAFFDYTASKITFNVQYVDGTVSLEQDAIIINGNIANPGTSFNAFASYYRNATANYLLAVSFIAVGRWKA